MQRILLVALVAGIVSGLLVGIFDNFFLVPVENRAITLEEERAEAAAAAAGEVLEEEPPLVPLWVQGAIGEPIFRGLFGIILGLLFVGGVNVVRRAAPTWNLWATSLAAGALGYWSLFLIPFLKYPMNPPGVGDPETLIQRQLFQTLFLILSIVGAAVALLAFAKLRDSLGPNQNPWPTFLGVAAGYIIFLAVILLAVPGNPDPVPVPIDLLELFRTLAMISHFLHWMLLALGVGLFLTWRQQRRGIGTSPGEAGRSPSMSAR